MADQRYTAYLSYSHKDLRWAEWLHRSLEAYRVPAGLEDRQGQPLPKTLAPIFRDRDDLSSASDLAETLGQALRHSDHLIVLCSPESAASRWVNEEIRKFRALGRGDRIHCVIVDGDPQAALDEGGCFPPALFDGEEAGGREPLAADPRAHADGKRLALLKIASGLLGVPLDALRRRDLTRRRRLQAVAALGVVAAVVLVGTAVTARLAERQERAQAEQMAAFIVDLGEELQGDLDLESLGRMSDTAMAYLDQIDPGQLTPASRIKVGKALRQVGNVSWHQGELEDAMEAFTRSLGVFEDLSAELPLADAALNNEVWFELSQAEFYRGYLLLEIGESEPSKAHFDRYLEIAEAQHEANPGDPRWLLEMSYATSALVNAGLNLMEPVDQDVLEAIDHNLALAEQALEANEGGEEALAHYGNELAFAADALMSACLLEDALAAREESLAITQTLLDAAGDSSGLELDVALRHNGLSGVLSSMGRLEAALNHQHAALEIFDKQLARDPTNETNITDVASAHRRIGRLLLFERDFEAADRHQVIARELLEPLVEDGELLTWQRDEMRALVLEEAIAARLAGDGRKALQILEDNRALVLSIDVGDELMQREIYDRVAYRYERWQLTGADPGATDTTLMQPLPLDQGEFTGCLQADLLARHGLMIGDRVAASNKAIYLERAGYRDPEYLEFCRSEALCAQ